jgi:hypothetical protein
MLLLIFLLFTKHFIVDFLLQGPYQYLNKGTYGHLGGILHAFLHGIATLICLYFVSEYHLLSLALATIDMVVHYHIDWLKVNINNKYGWKCNSSDKFWVLLGIDQYLHALTYILIIYILVNV